MTEQDMRLMGNRRLVSIENELDSKLFLGSINPRDVRRRIGRRLCMSLPFVQGKTISALLFAVGIHKLCIPLFELFGSSTRTGLTYCSTVFGGCHKLCY